MALYIPKADGPIRAAGDESRPAWAERNRVHLTDGAMKRRPESPAIVYVPKLDGAPGVGRGQDAPGAVEHDLPHWVIRRLGPQHEFSCSRERRQVDHAGVIAGGDHAATRAERDAGDRGSVLDERDPKSRLEGLPPQGDRVVSIRGRKYPTIRAKCDAEHGALGTQRLGDLAMSPDTPERCRARAAGRNHLPIWAERDAIHGASILQLQRGSDLVVIGAAIEPDRIVAPTGRNDPAIGAERKAVGIRVVREAADDAAAVNVPQVDPGVRAHGQYLSVRAERDAPYGPTTLDGQKPSPACGVVPQEHRSVGAACCEEAPSSRERDARHSAVVEGNRLLLRASREVPQNYLVVAPRRERPAVRGKCGVVEGLAGAQWRPERIVALRCPPPEPDRPVRAC